MDANSIRDQRFINSRIVVVRNQEVAPRIRCKQQTKDVLRSGKPINHRKSQTARVESQKSEKRNRTDAKMKRILGTLRAKIYGLCCEISAVGNYR